MDAMDYKIPEDIKSCIPDYFYYALAGELVSVFGISIFQKLEPIEYDAEGVRLSALTKEDCSYYDLLTSTGGWEIAFYATCKKLNLIWLYNYWKSLVWYESDIFDGEIENEIIERFLENDCVQRDNPYYKYISEKRGK